MNQISRPFVLEHLAPSYQSSTITRESFRAACLEGRLDEVKALLPTLLPKERLDYLNQMNPLGDQGELRHIIYELFIRYKNNPSARELWGQMLELFLQNGAEVDPILPYKHLTPLLVACRHGFKDLAALFLRYGANHHHISEEGSVYHIIVDHVQDIGLAKELIELLRRNGSDPDLQDWEGMPAIVCAAQDPNKNEVTKHLMQYIGIESFRIACFNCKLDVVREMLDTLDPTERSNYVNQMNPLGDRGELRHIIYELFIEYKNNPAEREAWGQMVELFLQNGAAVDPILPYKQFTPLLVACRHGFKDLVALFLRYRANPNHISDEGSAYHIIVEHVQEIDVAKELIELLKATGSDPDLHDREGLPAIVCAAKDSNKNGLTKCLMQYTNIKCLLHWASFFGNESLMHYLIQQDSSQVAVLASAHGYCGTPLDWAHASGDSEAIRYLDDYGDGKNPFSDMRVRIITFVVTWVLREYATRAGIRMLKNYIPRPMAGILARRVTYWALHELKFVYSSIKKSNGDFGKIAAANIKHFAVVFFMLYCSRKMHLS